MTTRRAILKLVGGGSVLAAAAGGGWYVMNGPSTDAREAWGQAGKPKEYRRRFLSYALLAPNPHNRQPWLVRLDGDDGLTLFCDLDRRLPETDPYDRQITLGCGAFLELLSIAAAHEGYRTDITPFPEGECDAPAGPPACGKRAVRLRSRGGRRCIRTYRRKTDQSKCLRLARCARRTAATTRNSRKRCWNCCPGDRGPGSRSQATRHNLERSQDRIAHTPHDEGKHRLDAHRQSGSRALA